AEYLSPLLAAAQKADQISEAVAKKLSDTSHPQGVFAVFALPEETPGLAEPFWRAGGVYLALEGIQDPGNLGAVARTAEALGGAGILLGGGCDRFHPKAQRAAMGALLRLPLLTAEDFCAQLGSARAAGLAVLAALPDQSAVPPAEVRTPGRGAVLVIGNEGAGLSEAAIAACAQRVTIPMRGCAQSLNAAAAATILLWELLK
ncbi:MAG: RNA methyltransferase, partial [Oscillospiraceae bacterium]|nr:RNA methyltransferase [Oscillospiraceae bacterium]